MEYEPEDRSRLPVLLHFATLLRSFRATGKLDQALSKGHSSMLKVDFESKSGTKELKNPVAVVDCDVVWQAECDVQDGQTTSNT
jgi:hypothetical protein